jgi:hypothetical protein
MELTPRKLPDRGRDAICLNHYSTRAEKACTKRSPKQMAGAQYPVLIALSLLVADHNLARPPSHDRLSDAQLAQHHHVYLPDLRGLGFRRWNDIKCQQQ